MPGPFDKELESITSLHTQDFARKLAHEVAKLILRKLGIDQASIKKAGAIAGKVARKKVGKAAGQGAKVVQARKPAPSQKRRASGDDRASVLDKVFRVVSAREGVAVAEVVKVTNLDRGPVASALKTLKQEGRIHMGGSRRFARYAMTQAAAERASETARKG